MTAGELVLAGVLGLCAGLLLRATLRAWEALADEDLGKVSPEWRPPIERPDADVLTVGRVKDRWAAEEHRQAKARVRLVRRAG